MDKVKILHILDKLSVDGSKIHGPARQIATRADLYDPMRYELLVCSLRTEDACADFLKTKGLKVICLGRNKFDPLALLDIFRIIRRWKPSLLHVHGYASWNFGRVAGKLMHLPVIVQEHFVDEKMPGYQRAADWCLKGSHGKALAVSNSVKRFMIKDRYVRETDIEVIWNGISLDDFIRSSPLDVKALRKLLSISPNATVVGIVGRLAEEKGHKYFLRAAKQISQHMGHVVFIIVGEGPLGQDLRRLARQLGIYEQVFFVGYQEDVFAYLSLFDVSVVASLSEGFCSVVIESFAAGTPVIITDLPSFRGIYKHHKNVLMVPPCDSDAMAAAIMHVLEHHEVAAELIRNGKKALSQFRMEDIAGKYIRVYDNTLQNWRKSKGVFFTNRFL